MVLVYAMAGTEFLPRGSSCAAGACPHLNNVFWGGEYRTITHGHVHPSQGIMYPSMGLEYAVSCCWIMQACKSRVVFPHTPSAP